MKNLKNKVAVGITMVIAFVGLGLHGESLNRYNLNATVYAVDGSEVFFEDTKGDIWSAYADGFKVGENVVLKMHTNYNSNKYDDIILKVKRA